MTVLRVGAAALVAALVAVLVAGLVGTSAQETPVRFRKLLLNPEFYSEGIHAGDFNNDRVIDIVAGPYYYIGPDFVTKVAFRAPRATPFAITGDSDCYAVFPYDFNRDGRTDILSMRRPGGSEAVWYENPGPAAGYWAEHVVHSQVENESAALLDIDDDGRPELITNSAGFGGWVAPDWARPSEAWTFRRVTGKGMWGPYSHGIGAGDVNGDGRSDLIFATGWWERPRDGAEGAWTAHPAPFWGQAASDEGAGGAQIHTYDVDNDGDNDVVTSLQAHGFGLAWFENLDGGKSFVQHPILGLPAESEKYGAAFSQLHAVALADIDGDGKKDIITGKRKGAHGRGVPDVNGPAVLYWFRLIRPARGAPRFEPFLIDSEAGIGTQVTVADVNGDGAPDILTARRDGAFVFFNERGRLR